MRELFEPRSIAIVGAAREPNKVGHVILKPSRFISELRSNDYEEWQIGDAY